MRAEDAAIPDLSLAHATLLELSPFDLIRVAASTGYRVVGLRLIPIDRPGEPRHTLAAGSAALRNVKALLSDTGLRVLDLEVAMIRDDVDLCSYLPSFESGAELGARYVLTNVYTTDRNAARERLEELGELARPFGLTPVIEFVSFASVATLGDAVDLIESTTRVQAGLLFDMLHFHTTGGTAVDLRRLPPDRLAYVHMDDGPADVPASIDERRRVAREARLFPGEGGADIASVLPFLRTDVPYAVEVTNPARARAMGPEAYARMGWETTMKFLQSFGGRATGG